MSKRRSRAFWERVVESAESGNETRVEVAKRCRVSLGTLQGWVYRLRRERDVAGNRTASSSVRVVPIALTAPPPARRLELHLGVDLGLCFDEGVAPEYITALALALRAHGS